MTKVDGRGVWGESSKMLLFVCLVADHIALIMWIVGLSRPLFAKATATNGA